MNNISDLYYWWLALEGVNQLMCCFGIFVFVYISNMINTDVNKHRKWNRRKKHRSQTMRLQCMKTKEQFYQMVDTFDIPKKEKQQLKKECKL